MNAGFGAEMPSGTPMPFRHAQSGTPRAIWSLARHMAAGGSVGEEKHQPASCPARFHEILSICTVCVKSFGEVMYRRSG